MAAAAPGRGIVPPALHARRHARWRRAPRRRKCALSSLAGAVPWEWQGRRSTACRGQAGGCAALVQQPPTRSPTAAGPRRGQHRLKRLRATRRVWVERGSDLCSGIHPCGGGQRVWGGGAMGEAGASSAATRTVVPLRWPSADARCRRSRSRSRGRGHRPSCCSRRAGSDVSSACPSATF